MMEAHKAKNLPFPSPERIEKVKRRDTLCAASETCHFCLVLEKYNDEKY